MEGAEAERGAASRRVVGRAGWDERRVDQESLELRTRQLGWVVLVLLDLRGRPRPDCESLRRVLWGVGGVIVVVLMGAHA